MPSPSESAPPNKWLVTLSISLGTLMGAVDASIVNVALPQIQGSLGATVQEITWIATGYSIALVILMPLTAFLGRQFGQKRLYLSCLGLFMVGSALCGTAQTLTQMIIYRIIQGLGAGALQPTEQAILRRTFPREEQGMAMAVFGIIIMLGPAIGPTIGGVIVDQYHWSWIFFINLPLGLAGFFMVSKVLREDPETFAKNQERAAVERRHLDWAGIALLCAALGCGQYVLEEGQREGWFESTLICGLTFAAVSLLALFIVRELTATAPVVQLRLFRDPTFASGVMVNGLTMAMLLANVFLQPLFMQEMLGFTTFQSGLALLPRSIVMMVAMGIVGAVYNRVPARLLIGSGVIFFVVSAYAMGQFNMATGVEQIVIAVSLQGIGLALVVVPLEAVALSNVPKHQMTDATGLNNLITELGGAIGLAVFATVFSRHIPMAKATVAAHVHIANAYAEPRLHAYAEAIGGGARAAGLRALASVVTREATVLAYDYVFVLGGVVFVLMVLPLVFCLRPGASTHGESGDGAEMGET
ncbi:DHA2 family efflux MFS transporter permease subunit [Pendulispora rubella]|uniref:DHA2 family efflux MFS transporter permease subunit n=1 Tax=Pendulispora rubella TaxID=2741070 RepID=A0ABZ2KVI6_9BACT